MHKQRKMPAAAVGQQGSSATARFTGKRKALSACVAAAIAAPAGAVLGQDQQIEEVVVVGYRASLIDSILTKRDSAQIVEAISAEDIGKLPDQSIADSIARLPGIAAQRLDGRASSISVRGLGEDFSATTVNGREQVSIGDNRGVEFDLYPSEIVSGVVVYKTPNASLATQGIAGTIDLRTVRPLDYSEQIIKGSIFHEVNDIGALNPDGEDRGNRFTASYIGQFNDRTVGLALVGNTTTSPNNEERWNSWGYPANGEGNLVLGGAKPFVRSSELERDSILGVLQWQPSERLAITADAMYIDFADEKILRGIEVPGQWGGPGPVVVNQVVNGFVTDGVFDGRSPVVRNDYEVREATLDGYGINLEYEFNDAWALEADLGRSEVDRRVWSLESYATRSGRRGENGDLASIRFQQSDVFGVQFTSDLGYTDYDLTRLGAAQGWGDNVVGPNAQDGFINTPSTTDELGSLRFDVTGEIGRGALSTVQFGVYFSDRDKEREDTGRYLVLPQSPDVPAVPDQYRLGTVDLSFIGIPGMIAYDSFAFWGDNGYTEIDDPSLHRFTNDYLVSEQISIAYAMADFDFSLGGQDAQLNVGLQYVDTDQSSVGLAVRNVDGQVLLLPTADGDTYGELLPSVSLNVNASENGIVRLGASRTLSRSRMDRMHAGGTYGYNEVAAAAGLPPWTFGGGNPRLRPNMADQYDISYEHYFREDGYVAIAGFFKNLKSWQLQEDLVFDMADLVNPALLPAGSTEGIATLWTDANGGDISGVEVTAAVPFGYFSDGLEGLGLVASASFFDSSLDDPNGEQIDVPGLSEEIFNVTAYYERGGFQARVSMRQREDFVGERFGLSFTREYTTVVGATLWDAQVSYNFAGIGVRWLEGLTATLQVLNITDEPYENLNGELTRDYQEFGSSYQIGLSYEF